MNKVSDAVDLFRSGCACSQAIAATYGPPLGLARDQAARIAAPFAGGMRMAETCGAVTGGLMMLGLRYCTEDCQTPAGRQKIATVADDFIAAFRQRNGSVACKALLGCDISTPEGMAAAKNGNLFKTACPKLVQDAAEILEEML